VIFPIFACRTTPMTLSITVFNKRQHLQEPLRPEATVVGRREQQPGFPSENGLTESAPALNVVIDDPLVAVEQLTIKRSVPSETSSEFIELTNHGASIALSSGPRIHVGRSKLSLPVSFYVGDSQIQIFDSHRGHRLDFALTTMRAKTDQMMLAADSQLFQQQRISPGPQTLGAWLETLREMQGAVAGSKVLFQLAARAVFNPGGMDGALVLVPTQEGLKIQASHIPYPDHGIGFREDLVSRVIETGETIYHDADLTDSEPVASDAVERNSNDSDDDLHHVAIVCPVIDAAGEVVAVVYGFRSLHRRNNRMGIRYLEAQFVQVVADALSAGMVRLEAEAQATRSKVLLEQAFAPSIARQLQTRPDALRGTNREVTVLFADLRGFSTISERIGAQESFELLADVMDQLSAAITDHDGVIIDYYGDGVSAFWNAPIDQPDHAILACQAAFEMLDCLPTLNQRWAHRLGETLEIGIGVHTGDACVGNSGSRKRLKYGPRGTTVNLASRLESLTKQMGVPFVVSEATAEKVKEVFDVTRVVRSVLRGMTTPIDVCRPFPRFRSIFTDRIQCAYTRALEAFESGQLDDALRGLRDLAIEYPEEKVVRFLLDAVSQQQQFMQVNDDQLDGPHGNQASNQDVRMGVIDANLS
jgi:class 3 adenylate cyclase